MNKRITIIIDDDVDKKLRHLQAKQIKESARSISYSKVVNDILRKNMK